MKQKNYECLLFDIDGTLLDFEASERVSMTTLFIKYGFGELTDEDIYEYEKINDSYWKALERGEVSRNEVLINRFVDFFKMKGIDETKAEEFNSDFQLALGDTIVFCDDAYTILKELKKDFRLIGVTNSTVVAQTKKLKMSGLDKVFDSVYISEVIGIEKPNRGYFDWVFTSEGIDETKKCLMIGDSLTSDIKGAVDYNIPSVWYNSKGKPLTGDNNPDHIISDLHELFDIVY